MSYRINIDFRYTALRYSVERSTGNWWKKWHYVEGFPTEDQAKAFIKNACRHPEFIYFDSKGNPL